MNKKSVEDKEKKSRQKQYNLIGWLFFGAWVALFLSGSGLHQGIPTRSSINWTLILASIVSAVLFSAFRNKSMGLKNTLRNMAEENWTMLLVTLFIPIRYTFF